MCLSSSVVSGHTAARVSARLISLNWTFGQKLRLRHTQGGSTFLTSVVCVCPRVCVVQGVTEGDPRCPPSGQMAGLYASMVVTEERGHRGIAGSSEDGQGGPLQTQVILTR